MHISKLRDSKFLQKDDVDPPILVTIKTMTEVNVAMEGQTADLRFALHFDELEKPLILNSTNGQLIAKVTGSEETEEWSGQRVVLYIDPNVSFNGKLIGGIRVRAPRKGETVVAKQGDDDEIPF